MKAEKLLFGHGIMEPLIGATHPRVMRGLAKLLGVLKDANRSIFPLRHHLMHHELVVEHHSSKYLHGFWGRPFCLQHLGSLIGLIYAIITVDIVGFGE